MSEQTNSTVINSQSWWEDYFKKQWDDNEGRKQTRGFMEALVENLPDPEKDYLATHNAEILDWGCAFGDGVDVLSKRFPRCRVIGSDFATKAIGEAKSAYPQYEFLHTETGKIERDFDIVLTSNCLEHFESPLEIMQEHLKSCRQMYVIFVPYKEAPFCECHTTQFREECFPEWLSGFSRICCKVVDIHKPFWPGKQILVIYGSTRYIHERNRWSARLNDKSNWDSYYTSLAPPQFSQYSQGFSSELADHITELLPNSAKVMEVGCGSGEQSLALARMGDYDLTLVDYSEPALEYAKKLFSIHNFHAKFELCDGFSSSLADYDLVFNAGVLEHYSTDEQIAFLRSMAGRSRKYVLSLVLNPQCYWYWIWRNKKTSENQWPFGKEVPIADLSRVFKEAGLNFLGQLYIGCKDTEKFIKGISGMDEDTRNAILSIHRSGMVPDSQSAYLVAALGVVAGEECQVPRNWTMPKISHDQKIFDMTASVSDALAGRIGAEVQQKRLERKLEEVTKKSISLEDRLTCLMEQYMSLNNEVTTLKQSRLWQLAARLLSIRTRWFPSGSLRERFARMVYHSFKKAYHFKKELPARLSFTRRLHGVNSRQL